jgi:tetratricopeptide (TPR) repeat protein
LLINFASMYSTGTIEPPGGRDEIEEAFELARQSGDPELHFTVHEEVIDRLQFSGRLAEAAALADEYVTLGRALAPGTTVRGNPVAWSIGRRAWVWNEMGRLDAATDALHACVESLRETGDLEFQSYAEVVWAQNRLLAGDVDAACLHARRGVDVAEKVGSGVSRVWAYQLLGLALARAGESAAAVEHLDRALQTARETRTWLTIEAEILAHLAEACLGAGEVERAQRLAEEAIETGRHKKTPVWEAQAHLALARILLNRCGAKARDEIESALASGLSLIERTQAYAYEPHVREVRAALLCLLGDDVNRQSELRAAHRLFTAMGATGHAARLAKEPA